MQSRFGYHRVANRGMHDLEHFAGYPLAIWVKLEVPKTEVLICAASLLWLFVYASAPARHKIKPRGGPGVGVGGGCI